jgi:copper oxidase (laccase) domain-containing protein
MKKVTLHPQVLLAYSEAEDGNMDYRFGTKKEVLANRDAFFEKLGLNPRDSIEGEQIHFDRLLPLNEENSKMWRGMAVTGVDGFISNQIEIAMMLRVADCLPVALYDPVNHRAGLLHVGWRGAAKDFHLYRHRAHGNHVQISSPRPIGLAWPLGPSLSFWL